MLVTTTKIINGITFNHTYSDIGNYIKRDGVIYDEAYDPISISREYVETDQPIYTKERLEQMPEEAKKELLKKASTLGITIAL